MLEINRICPAEICEETPLEVSVSFRIGLNLLRLQKRALLNIVPDRPLTPDQEEAVDGILNLLDTIQDSVVEQGLADESAVFDTAPVQPNR